MPSSSPRLRPHLSECDPRSTVLSNALLLAKSSVIFCNADHENAFSLERFAAIRCRLSSLPLHHQKAASGGLRLRRLTACFGTFSFPLLTATTGVHQDGERFPKWRL